MKIASFIQIAGLTLALWVELFGQLEIKCYNSKIFCFMCVTHKNCQNKMDFI